MTIFGLVTVQGTTDPVYTRNPILFRDTHLTRQLTKNCVEVRFTAASVTCCEHTHSALCETAVSRSVLPHQLTVEKVVPDTHY